VFLDLTIAIPAVPPAVIQVLAYHRGGKQGIKIRGKGVNKG
jgi:hypothetical protein